MGWSAYIIPALGDASSCLISPLHDTRCNEVSPAAGDESSLRLLFGCGGPVYGWCDSQIDAHPRALTGCHSSSVCHIVVIGPSLAVIRLSSVVIRSVTLILRGPHLLAARLHKVLARVVRPEPNLRREICAEIYPRYTRDIPEMRPRYAPRYAREIYPRYTRDIRRDIPEMRTSSAPTEPSGSKVPMTHDLGSFDAQCLHIEGRVTSS